MKWISRVWIRIKKINTGEKISLILALIAVMLSFWANLKVEEANRIALDANKVSATANAISADANELSTTANSIANNTNDLAIESNKINKQEAQPHPRIANGPDFTDYMLLDCASSDTSKPYGIIVAATPKFDVVNYGAQPIWLHKTVWLDGGREWNISLHEQHEDVYLPFNFTPESEHQWLIVALHSTFFSDKADALKYIEEFPTYFNIDVEFQFENGVNLPWTFTLTSPSGSDKPDFSTDCNQHSMFFMTQY